MSAEDAPLARRLRRPTWRDPRLGIGVLLVVGSVALGTWAVRDAAATIEVYVARHTLTPGAELSPDSLMVREVRLPGSDETYLQVHDGMPSGAVATRVVGAGELVPTAAVGQATTLDLRPVVVPVGAALPTDIGAGSVVDLWFTAAAGTTERAPGEPELLVPGLVLAQVLEEDSVFAGASGASVELLVPAGEVAGVLAALAKDGELVVVPVPGGQAGTSGA